MIARIEELSGEPLSLAGDPPIVQELAERLVQGPPGGDGVRTWILNMIHNAFLERGLDPPAWFDGLRGSSR